MLLPEKRGNQIIAYKVFPQPLMIKLFCFLSNYSKDSNKPLVLQNIVDHFTIYGIDFTTSNEARKHLISKLMQQGLLHGAKDAGNNAPISTPVKLKKNDSSQ